MADIRDWNPVAIHNSDPSPDGYPEGMLPGGVNDSDRETQAAVRRKWEDADWFDWGHEITYVAPDQFSVPGDVTGIYHPDRRVRAVMPVGGTIYGRVLLSTFVTSTTIIVAWDSGNLLLESGIQVSVGIQIANAESTSLPMYWIQNEFGLLDSDILCYQDKNAVDIDGGDIDQAVNLGSLPNLAGGSSAVAPAELDVLVGIDTGQTLEARLQALVPVGTIRPWPSTDLTPLNQGGDTWLACDGAQVSQATYDVLYSLIGHSFGPDPGGGNFILPDLRGRAAFGYDAANATGRLTGYREGIDASGIGNVGGEQAHTQTEGELASHGHPESGATDNYPVDAGISQNVSRELARTTGDTGDDEPMNVTPPGVVLNWAIRAG